MALYVIYGIRSEDPYIFVDYEIESADFFRLSPFLEHYLFRLKYENYK